MSNTDENQENFEKLIAPILKLTNKHFTNKTPENKNAFTVIDIPQKDQFMVGNILQFEKPLIFKWEPKKI